MKNSFGKVAENRLSRKFGGGLSSGSAEPYVSGTFFIHFSKLPDKLKDYTGQGSSKLASNDEIKAVLSACCLGVTPPGGTLNSIEFTGLGGVKWTVPGNIDYNTSVSVKFLEMKGTPILDIFHSWIKMIRDYRMGVTYILNDDDSGAGYSKSTYAGTMYYWTTDPSGTVIDYYACYDGVYPTKDPQDLYSGDVETIGRLDVEQEFKFDYAWHEPWVKTNCEGFNSTFTTAAKSTLNAYKAAS